MRRSSLQGRTVGRDLSGQNNCTRARSEAPRGENGTGQGRAEVQTKIGNGFYSPRILKAPSCAECMETVGFCDARLHGYLYAM
jgi:hypothetical protein